MQMLRLTWAIGQWITLLSQTPVWFRFCADWDDFAQDVLDEMVTFKCKMKQIIKKIKK